MTRDETAARAAFLAEAAREPWLLARSLLGALLCFMTVVFVGVAAQHAAEAAGPVKGAAALIVGLLALAAFTPALAVAAPLLHQRRFSRLWGAERRPNFSALGRGAAAAVGAALLALGLEAALDTLAWAPTPPPRVAVMVALAVLIAAQATAEELFFRGYLLQATARWAARGPILWAAPSILLFTAMHATPEAPLYTLLWPFIFGVVASALVWRTGGLSTGIGFHIAHNWVSLLVFSEPGAATGVGPLTFAADAPRVALFAGELMIALAAFWLLLRRARPERPACSTVRPA